MAEIYQHNVESLAISESLANQHTSGISDSIVLSEEIVKAITTVTSDSISVSESLAIVSGKPLADAITFVDGIVSAVEFYRTDADTISMTEAVQIVVKPFLQDSISFKESITKIIHGIDGVGNAVRRFVFDSQTFIESVIESANKGRTDTLAIAEAIVGAIVGKGATDSVSHAESKVWAFVKPLTDSITFNDGTIEPEPIWWGSIKWMSACHGGI